MPYLLSVWKIIIVSIKISHQNTHDTAIYVLSCALKMIRTLWGHCHRKPRPVICIRRTLIHTHTREHKRIYEFYNKKFRFPSTAVTADYIAIMLWNIIVWDLWVFGGLLVQLHRWDSIWIAIHIILYMFIKYI